MSSRPITKSMVDEIIKLKDDRDTKYTFDSIALYLFNKYSIKVTKSCVAYWYHKNNKQKTTAKIKEVKKETFTNVRENPYKAKKAKQEDLDAFIESMNSSK